MPAREGSGADFDQRHFTILEISTLALRTAANLSIGYHSVPNTPSRKRFTVDRQKRWKLLCPIGLSSNLVSEI